MIVIGHAGHCHADKRSVCAHGLIKEDVRFSKNTPSFFIPQKKTCEFSLKRHVLADRRVQSRRARVK